MKGGENNKMNILKKIAVGAATLSAASGLYAVPVFAVAESSNNAIYDDSFADSSSYDNDEVDFEAINKGSDLINVDVAAASSGLNSQNKNEDGNDLSAGNTAAEYETENFLNVNELSGHDGATATNANISGSSDGDAISEDNDKVEVENKNIDTTVFNLTASIANSGLNEQNKNEDGNKLVAGTAWSYAGTSNVVNHNVVSGSCSTTPSCPDSSPTAVASNTNITDGSFADSKATDNDQIDVDNTNKNTTLTNITVAVSNSGANSQNGNEDGNEMTTGATGASVEASNYVNVNSTNVGGSGAQATNTNISGGSDGDAKAQDNDKIEVENKNENTTVTNVSVAVSNSGGNTQSHNEDGNTMTTGTAASMGTTTNVVNSNNVSW